MGDPMECRRQAGREAARDRVRAKGRSCGLDLIGELGQVPDEIHIPHLLGVVSQHLEYHAGLFSVPVKLQVPLVERG
jgi:hypothetical protein